MKVLFSWLKDYVDIDISVEKVCDKLVSAGFEVEEITDLSETFTNVVVGKILSVKEHPNADRLRVCEVDAGNGTIQIVTNAVQLKKDDLVPVALDGALLATGQAIKIGELRGVQSDGMFCGGEELNADDNVYPGASGDSVLILSSDEIPGTSMIDVLGYNDYVLDISVTPNRPDCNSIWGIAREIGAVMDKPVRFPDIGYEEDETVKTSDFVTVDVQATDLCPAYNMQAIFDLKVKTSPLWVTRRLHALGLRGINNIVDITNYVLLELGQPMHAFDQDDIKDKTIIVRRAKEGEKIIPLDENEYILSENNLVIADKERAVGLAGIMGGANSGIKPSTKAVCFESAKFIKENIRRSSRRLGLRSDSSARFEKGVDAFTAELALSRALHLTEKLGCGKIAKGRISTGEKPAKQEVVFDFSRVEKLLGISIPESEAVRILNSLDIKAEIMDGVIRCIVPEYREDLRKDCDIIEELIRLHGYDNIHSTLLKDVSVTAGGRTEYQNASLKAKNILIGNGYMEMRTYSFGNATSYEKLLLEEDSCIRKTIRLLNPLSEELAVMRTTLSVNLLSAIATNLSRRNNDLRLFELAKCFIPESLPLKKQPEEKNMLCIGLYSENAYFFELMNTVETLLDRFNIDYELVRSNIPYLHPGVSAEIITNGVIIGYAGKVHPVVAENFDIKQNTYIAEFDFDKLFKNSKPYVSYMPFGKYPTSVRDLAVVVSDEIPAGEIKKAIMKASDLVISVKLFDIYKGALLGNSKSLAFSITFGHNERTLTDAEIEKAVQRILKALEYKFNAKLRS